MLGEKQTLKTADPFPERTRAVFHYGIDHGFLQDVTDDDRRDVERWE